jgi:hypothetical protein
MKRILDSIKAFGFRINMVIVSILLIVIYILVMIPYSIIFRRKEDVKWTYRNKQYIHNDIGHMW